MARRDTGTADDRADRAPVVHRITTSTAAVVNDPDRADLAQLVGEVERSGRGSFLIGQARAGQADESWLQAVRRADGWTLEARDEAGPGHVRSETADTALVEDVFVWWTQGLRAWRDSPLVEWRPVVRDQQWLTSA
ncbi:hypothetical protein [Jatrophihabitans endophyticus]|uniref:hypothetical protein n=1 Tax=Jatrophihabitans endophyticus TaxID=1206085 RepID=UPI0019FF02CB|nr:hypothetical protein [Jatrophihabitans endophyticus]MBE7188349.1 hypothetical protein [Jatrophihabitans endophyticus]